MHRISSMGRVIIHYRGSWLGDLSIDMARDGRETASKATVGSGPETWNILYVLIMPRHGIVFFVGQAKRCS